jgi:hypothetical protein
MTVSSQDESLHLKDDVAVQTALTVRVTFSLSFGFDAANKAEPAVSMMNSRATRFISILPNY